MIRTESSGGWQNRDCSIALPYVCKKKPNATAERPPPGERGEGGRAGRGGSHPGHRVTATAGPAQQHKVTLIFRSSQLFNGPARV